MNFRQNKHTFPWLWLVTISPQPIPHQWKPRLGAQSSPRWVSLTSHMPSTGVSHMAARRHVNAWETLHVLTCGANSTHTVHVWQIPNCISHTDMHMQLKWTQSVVPCHSEWGQHTPNGHVQSQREVDLPPVPGVSVSLHVYPESGAAKLTSERTAEEVEASGLHSRF